MVKNMWPFKKEPKVEFLCRMPAARHLYPIVPMRELKVPFMDKAIREFKAKRRCPFNPNNHIDYRTIGKCPGIRSIFNTGWLVRTWQDIHFEIDKVNDRWKWSAPVPQFSMIGEELLAVDRQFGGNFENTDYIQYQGNFFRIQTPWLVKIPKGYSMLIKPVPYQDHHVFTTMEGIQSWEYGYLKPTMFLQIHKTGNFTIKAGTPIGQMILVEDKNFEYEVRDITEEEEKRMRMIHQVIPHSFVSNFRVIKKAISSIMKDVQ